MRPAVKIDDLTDALDMVAPESGAWLDLDTGRVCIVPDYLRDTAESDETSDLERLAGWEKDELAALRPLLDAPDRGIRLPTPFDFDEYRHIKRFIGTLSDPGHADELWRAIQARGAFRRFKDTAHRLGVIDAWHAYRDAAVRRLMLDWAHVNGIAVDKSPGRAAWPAV